MVAQTAAQAAGGTVYSTRWPYELRRSTDKLVWRLADSDGSGGEIWIRSVEDADALIALAYQAAEEARRAGVLRVPEAAAKAGRR